MRKAFAVLSAALLLAVLLCGCAQKAPAAHSWDSGVQGVCVRKTAFL